MISNENLNLVAGDPMGSISMRNERIYRCSQCPKSYTLASSLSTHFHNTHGKDSIPMSCNYCHKIFKNRSNLVRHVRIIHTLSGNPRFNCNFCSSTFTAKYNLYVHMRKIHHKDKSWAGEIK
jgi:uncharacterized Zn-finger protein